MAAHEVSCSVFIKAKKKRDGAVDCVTFTSVYIFIYICFIYIYIILLRFNLYDINYCEDRLEDSFAGCSKGRENALRMVMATGGWLPQASPFLMKAGSGAAPVNVNTQLSAAESRKTTLAGGADTRNEPSSVVFALYLFHTGFGEGDRCRWFTEVIKW